MFKLYTMFLLLKFYYNFTILLQFKIVYLFSLKFLRTTGIQNALFGSIDHHDALQLTTVQLGYNGQQYSWRSDSVLRSYITARQKCVLQP